MKNSILNGDADRIVNEIDVNGLVTEFLEKERRKAMRGTFIKVRPLFPIVNERYWRRLATQVTQTAEIKKCVFNRVIEATEGITREEYLITLRDAMFNRLLPNIRFHPDCIKKQLSPFVAAQNIAMVGYKQIDNVLNSGIDVVYKGNLDTLKDEVFTEAEMAKAKFASIVGGPSARQLNEATRLTEIIKEVVKQMNEQSKSE